MKPYLLFIILFFVSCGTTKKMNECSTLAMVIEKSFSDDFFNSYRNENEKLSIVTEFNDVYRNLIGCKNRNLGYSVDSLNQGHSKYITINDFSDTKIITLQLGCYNEEESPYYVMYSTSFEKLGNGNLRLLSDVSPFIDTIQIRKN